MFCSFAFFLLDNNLLHFTSSCEYHPIVTSDHSPVSVDIHFPLSVSPCTLCTAPSASVHSNGVQSSPFPLQRGTRQGCPLSPTKPSSLQLSGSDAMMGLRASLVTATSINFRFMLTTSSYTFSTRCPPFLLYCQSLPIWAFVRV